MNTERSYWAAKAIACLLIGLSIVLFLAGLSIEQQHRLRRHQRSRVYAQLIPMRTLGVSDQLVTWSTLSVLSLGLGVGLLVCRRVALDTQILTRAAGRSLASDPKGADLLLATLNDVHGAEWAADSLAHVKDRAVADGCVAHLSNSNYQIRRAAAEQLKKAAWVPSNDREKAFYLTALGNLEKATELGAEALDALVLASQSIEQQNDALCALPKLGAIAVNPLLDAYRQFADHANWEAVALVATSLGELGAEAAVAVHVLADSSGEPYLASTSSQAAARRAVKDALKKIQANLDWN